MSLVQRLLSQSTVIFAARLFGAGLTFLAQIAIARFLGPGVLGDYILITATVNIIAVIMPLGFETIGTYFAAEYRAKGEGGLLRRFMRGAYGHIVLTGLVLLAVGYPLAGLFGEAGRTLAAHWMPALLLATATATVLVSASLLIGLKRPFAGFFAETLVRPMLALAGFGVTLATRAESGITTLLWVLAGGYCAVALVQLAILLGSTASLPKGTLSRPRESRRWWRFAVPWIALAVAGDFFFDIDLLLLAGHLGKTELAIFGVCTRVFSLASFGVAAVYAVTLPDMFESEARDDRPGFLRKIAEANFVASALSVGLLAAVAIFAPLALLLFGPVFQAGVAPLAILCAGLVVRSVFGPASIMLSVHDRPYASLPAVGVAMVVLIVANLTLVPAFGLIGASVAALMAMVVWSAALWFTALKVTGVDVSIRARLGRGTAAMPEVSR